MVNAWVSSKASPGSANTLRGVDKVLCRWKCIFVAAAADKVASESDCILLKC